MIILCNFWQVATPFSAHPKCYKCLKLDNREVIVLENLRTLGYELHAKRSCLNVHHSRLVLKEYAKLHALSFALKDQNRKQFDAIAKFSHDAWVDILSAASLQRSMKNSRQDVLALLKKRGDMHLYEKFSQVSKDGPKKILEIFQTTDEQSVILHGDCWNNNFMFQYQNGDRTTPTAVKILDWQTSSLRSPACDLAMFLCLTSAHSAHMFDQLLKEYYEQLSQYLVQLGSSPSLFTFEDLQRHWKKFIVAAIIFAPSGFSFALADQEKIPEFGDITEEIDVAELMDFPIPETDDFYGRLKPLLEYLTL
ncbi:unnamed protein product [Acanthoscelides obtectus]|uniref:CHK kinase-like domain-containing protein n=1 Tax=Acanthoscelides obtectus TaxID=200917 RepID=A0A9P0Q4E4_ACAOB|nr:unnamed protein product [Acanthoscelides obtectus]